MSSPLRQRGIRGSSVVPILGVWCCLLAVWRAVRKSTFIVMFIRS